MEERETGLSQETEVVLPKMCEVIMLNDDFTTMEFVVYLLQDIFSKTPLEAESIMLEIHNSGHGICGVYPYDIAQTKVALATKKARAAGFPLRIIIRMEG